MRTWTWKQLLGLVFLFFSSLSYGQESYVLLISYDGFRHDYVEQHNLPNFKKFIAGGAAAKALTPCFPSKTFPNHYAIITGMYPANNGLVDNGFYDRPRDVTYLTRNRELVQDAYFYGGLPIWQLVQQHGKKSASFFWVGSEAPVAGEMPSYFKYYSGKVPNEARIDTVMKWFQLPMEDRPVFVSLYFSLVDDAGHASGPEGELLEKSVKEADRLLGIIMEGIRGLDIPVNVVITSDHGMYELDDTPGTVIVEEKVLSHLDDQVIAVSNGAHIHLYLKEGVDQKEVFRSLKERRSNYDVYRAGKFPKRWHYDNDGRIGDILLTADPGHYFLKHKAAYMRQSNPPLKTWGVHGYDPHGTPEMGGIFYANGPGIKKGVTLKAVENIHVYPLLAYLLNVPTPEIDGQWSKVKKMIQD